MPDGTTQVSAASREMFFAAYDGQPPWDVGHPQAALMQLLDEGIIRGRVLDLGCGTGEHALAAAERGLDALGVDMVPGAIEQARSKASSRGSSARFLVADALDLGLGEQAFDTVIDSGLFHVFSDEDRLRYEGELSRILTVGGVYVLMCFSDAERGAEGPRRIREEEIRETFQRGWIIRLLRPATFQSRIHPDGAKAWLAVVERTG